VRNSLTIMLKNAVLVLSNRTLHSINTWMACVSMSSESALRRLSDGEGRSRMSRNIVSCHNSWRMTESRFESLHNTTVMMSDYFDPQRLSRGV